MTDVALVGLGNLGSRHLQGLARSESPLRIRLVDPSQAAIDRARERWLEVGGDRGPHTLLKDDLRSYDVAIIATTADHRAAATAALAATANVGTWILEKPLTQTSADLDRIEQVVGARCWVNTPRRMIAWHQAIAKELRAAGGPLDVVVEGGPWGLACNAIHFIDLVSWWSGSEPVAIDVSGLNARWHDSKRRGFSEVFGRLQIRYGDGSHLALVSTADGGRHVISAATQAGRWIIDEGSGRCERPDGTTLDGRMEYQSELTGSVIDRLTVGEDPALPQFASIAAAERLLLSALIPHRMAAGGPVDRLDVT